MYGTTVEGNRAHWMMVPLSLGAGCCYPLWSLVTIWFGENSTQARWWDREKPFICCVWKLVVKGNCKDTKQAPTVLETWFQCLFSVLFWNWMIGRNSVVLEALKTVPSVEYVPIIVAWWSSFGGSWAFGEIMSIHVVFFVISPKVCRSKSSEFPFLELISLSFWTKSPFWIQVVFLGWFPPAAGIEARLFSRLSELLAKSVTAAQQVLRAQKPTLGRLGRLGRLGSWDDWPRIGLNMLVSYHQGETSWNPSYVRTIQVPWNSLSFFWRREWGWFLCRWLGISPLKMVHLEITKTMICLNVCWHGVFP